MLAVRTLGRFDIQIGGVSLLESADFKRGLLLIYLLEKGIPQSRAEVARLLWPDSDDAATLGNLRSLLLRMRRDGIDDYLQVDRTTISIRNHAAIDYDVARWRQLTTPLEQASFTDLLTAAELYQGDFLVIDALDSYPLLDEWVVSLRTEIEVQAASALSVLLKRGIELHEFEAILPHARRLSTIAPYSSDAQCLLLQIMVGTNQLAEALQEFHEYKRRLQEDIGISEIDPKLASTVSYLMSPQRALVETTARPLPSSMPKEPAIHQVDKTPVNALLPYLTTPLIGRKTEVEVIKQLLHKQHRLISVVGMGGIGKSHIIRSMLPFLQDRFGAKLHFVDLEPVDALHLNLADQLLRAIAMEQKLTLKTEQPLFEQVTSTFSEGVHCLVLDNLEVTPATTRIVEVLLQNSPQLHIIATSRVSLHLRSEQNIVVPGLSVRTTATDDEQPEMSEAARLFVEHMQNTRLGFDLTERDRHCIDSICQQVGGLPLAIKLAAEQSNYYELEEVAEIVFHDNNLLASEFSDSRETHQSINEILKNMWTHLGEEERSAIKAAALFQGDWHHDALQAIVSTPRAIYMKLVSTSILDSKYSGWFSLHPLVKRFVLSHLSGQYPAEMTKQYITYYLGLLNLGEHLLEPVSIIAPETLNVLQRQQSDVFNAWRQAVGCRAWDLLRAAIISMGHYVEITKQYAEGIDLLQLILDHLPAASLMTTSQQHLAAQTAFFIGILNTKANRTAPVESLHIEAIGWIAQVGTPHEIAIVHRHAAMLLPNAAMPPQLKLLPYTREAVKQSAYT
ncbi:hypothetical protein GC175_12055 [bacterium]|nr:hypothetical protein [bacterium]